MQESSEGEGDPSAVSDAQDNSSSEVCSVESEVADPSWVPPPVDALTSRCPLRAPDRRRPGGKRTRPPAGGRKEGALLRALSLRSRTITMGTQKRRDRARLLQQRSSRPQAGPRTRRSEHGEAPATGLPTEDEIGRRAHQQERKRPPFTRRPANNHQFGPLFRKSGAPAFSRISSEPPYGVNCLLAPD